MPRRLVSWLNSPWKDLSDRERLLLRRSVKLTALPLTLAVAIPLLIAIGAVVHDTHARSNQNRILINRVSVDEQRLGSVVHQLREIVNAQSTARAENRRRFVESDLTLCRRIEVVRKQIRDSITFDLKRTQATLRLIGIDPSSKKGLTLIQNSRAQTAALQRRFAPNKCKSLPSAQANEPQP